MNSKILALLVFTLACVTRLTADTLLESYVAVLSGNDHFSSKGARLDNAAAIIRQDRANFHKLGKRDAGDQTDRFFADANNRESLEQLLSRGHAKPSSLRAIVNGTPTVTVSIYQTDGGRNYVNVVIDDPGTAIGNDPPNDGGQAGGDTLLESYVAVLSEQDHLNSKGGRLDNAAAIIRQDRANYHKFNIRDDGDQNDSFFANANNRDTLEQLLKGGTSNAASLRAIVNGTPTVTVSIFRNAAGRIYVNVLVNE